MHVDTKLIIVEGPDGGGKTTLIEKLRSIYADDFWVVHHGAYLDVAESELSTKYLRPMISRRHKCLIYDRSWYAEPIYGEVMRGGKNRVTVGWRRMLERVALGRRGLVILALPPYERCLETFTSRRDREYLDDALKLKRVYDRYDRLQTALPMMYYDFTKQTISDVARWLHDASTPTPIIEVPGIGSWDPGRVTLLVGEQSNDPQAERYPQLVFVSSTGRGGGCGPWFAEELERLRIPESRLYWVNARDHARDLTSPVFVDLLKPKKIIALGGVAAAWCCQHELDKTYEVVEVTHPQFWKRFHHREPWGELRRAFNHINQQEKTS